MKVVSEEIKIRIVYDKNRGIDPQELNDIICGLSKFYSSAPKVANLNCETSVRVVSANSGSIELGFYISLVESGFEYFNNAKELFNCLEIIEYPNLKDIKEYWNSIVNVNKTLNDLYNQYQLNIILGGGFVAKVWHHLKKKRLLRHLSG